MPIEATAAVVRKPDGPFSMETVVLEDPRDDEILVRIKACGVCHTDMIAQHRTPLPAVFGHEGTGVVESAGAKANRVRPGDRVIISYPFCGTCPNCIEGRAYICDHSMPLSFAGTRLDHSKTISLKGEKISGAFFQQSSFSTHAITPERDVVPITGDHPPEMLAAIPCGVMTGAGAVLNTLKVGPGKGLAVFGAGAVGLSAIMAGRLSGAHPLIAVDIIDTRLELAHELGATHVLHAGAGGVADRIREITQRGVDFSFETSSDIQAFRDAVDCLCMGGVCGFVTSPEGGREFPFAPGSVLMRGASLQGIILGSAMPNTFLPKIIELNQQGRFPYERLITTYAFTDINQAFADSEAGKAIKPVLIMS